MPPPRASKIERPVVEPADAPDWKETLTFRDPYGLGPKRPWLKIVKPGVPKPDRLERLVDGEWVSEGDGVWRIHSWLGSERAIVSRDQVRLLEMAPDGSTVPLWQGPALYENYGGGRWGDNWMFAAAGLGDGRWLAVWPDTSVDERDERTWLQELVLLSPEGERLASLPLPERTDSAVKKGRMRRFMVRVFYPACDGRVAIVTCEGDVLALGVYDIRLAWIGKTTMPRLGGGVWIDGREALVSTSLADSKINWRRLDGLEALWEKKAKRE